MGFQLFRDAGGGWRYRVAGDNGEIMVTSEAYTREPDAFRGAHDLIIMILDEVARARPNVKLEHV